MVNFYEALNSFQDAIKAAKLGTPDIKPDGELYRYHVEGDKGGTLNGWYVFFPTPIPAGAFGSWKTGQTERWCVKGDSELSSEERQALAQQLEAAKQLRKQQQYKTWDAAAKRALARFNAAMPLDGISSFPYLKRKRVYAHGLALEGGRNLLVPLRDIAGRLWSLQVITPDGSKRFMGGGKTSGMFHIIGVIDPFDVVYVGEGFATCETVHRCQNAPVVCAMTADNLMPVALAIRAKYPQVEIIIAGDNDRFTDGNPGATKAAAAARAVGGALVLPEFPEECTTGTDFNDLMVWELSQ